MSLRHSIYVKVMVLAILYLKNSNVTKSCSKTGALERMLKFWVQTQIGMINSSNFVHVKEGKTLIS